MEQIGNATVAIDSIHPYYPLEAEIVGYLANEFSVPVLLALFAGACAAIFGVTLALVSSLNARLAGAEKLIILWFVLSGCIHLFFEGYFVYNHARMGRMSDLFGQLWKEYSLSDSRYLTIDPFVVCMETITAVVWGPLSFTVAYMITVEHPLRHPLQTIVSLGQLYGDVLYYATSFMDLTYKGISYCRPEAYYFWCYFFFMNTFWIIIPLILLYSSVTHSGQAFQALAKTSNSHAASKKRV